MICGHARARCLEEKIGRGAASTREAVLSLLVHIATEDGDALPGPR